MCICLNTMAIKIYKIQSTKFTYSGAVFGAVDEETRSLDSFFFGVFVAIFIKSLMCIFRQEKPKSFEIGANFVDIFVFGYALPRLPFSKGVFPRAEKSSLKTEVLIGKNDLSVKVRGY